MGFQCRWAGAVVLQSEPCATLQRLCRSASGRAGSLLMQHFGKGNFLHPPPSHTSPLCHPLSWGLCGGVGGGGRRGNGSPQDPAALRVRRSQRSPRAAEPPPGAPAPLRSPPRPPSPCPGTGLGESRSARRTPRLRRPSAVSLCARVC